MSKPTGAICNLDCEYCFFLSKEELYPGSGFRVPPDVHEAYVSQLLAAQRGADEIVVAFQGGEPTLMGIDFFRRTLELEAQYPAPGQRILRARNDPCSCGGGRKWKKCHGAPVAHDLIPSSAIKGQQAPTQERAAT